MKRGEAYKCTKGGNCVVGQNQTGLACSGCRLQKCVRLGMSKEGIRQGRYTLQERTSTIMEVRKLKEEEDLTENSKEHQSCNSVKCEAELPPLKNYYWPLLSEPSRSDSGLSGSHYPCTSSSSSNSLLIHQQHSFTEFSQSQTGSLDPDNPSLSSSFVSSLESSSETHSHHSIPHSSSAGACQNTPAAVERTFPVITGNVSEESVLLYIESLMMGYTEMKPFTKDMSDEEIHALLQDGFTKYNQKIELFGNMDPLPANIYNEIFNMTNMDIDGRTKILEIIRTELVTVIHEYVRFTHGIPAFKELHPNDQASLLKAARLEFFLMLSYRTLDPETGMMISYTGHVLPIRQFCAYAPEDMSTSWLEVSRDIRRLHLHPKEHAAMLAICLTFTDRCSLQNPGAVERIQTDLLEVLQYLLRERYREGCGRQLAKIMDVFVKLRGLNEEFLMVYQKICQDRFLIEQLPELLQFLFDE
ncbi:vitamin D3 receptor-like isoform X2 [Ostrea edulis]|nr:vitamin D3 receptor-like isoform X2 [Ostrea edulis]